jgi:hypothetical protein
MQSAVVHQLQLPRYVCLRDCRVIVTEHVERVASPKRRKMNLVRIVDTHDMHSKLSVRMERISQAFLLSNMSITMNLTKHDEECPRNYFPSTSAVQSELMNRRCDVISYLFTTVNARRIFCLSRYRRIVGTSESIALHEKAIR